VSLTAVASAPSAQNPASSRCIICARSQAGLSAAGEVDSDPVIRPPALCGKGKAKAYHRTGEASCDPWMIVDRLKSQWCYLVATVFVDAEPFDGSKDACELRTGL
jgi:hypothetical protein